MWFSRCIMLSCASLLLLVLLPSGTRAQSLTIRGGFTYSGLLRRLLMHSKATEEMIYLHPEGNESLLSRYVGVLIPPGADISELPPTLQDQLLALFESEESTPQPNSVLNAGQLVPFQISSPQQLSPLSPEVLRLPEVEFHQLKTKVAEQMSLLRVYEKVLKAEEHHMLFVNDFVAKRRRSPVSKFEQFIVSLEKWEEGQLLATQTFLQRHFSKTQVEFEKEKQKLQRLQQELLKQEQLRN